ncbi:hypothetical protein D3C72_2309210 [compost metagenome]
MLSLVTKKPPPWIAASSARPVATTLPPRPMFWVVEPTSTPVAWLPAYIEAKLSRLDLKP